MADHPAERVQQRQRVGERRQRAVRHVHPHVALRGEQRAEDLAGHRRGDQVGVEPLQRHVALRLAQRLPHRAPELHRLARVGELLRQRLGEQLGADPQQPLGELGDLGTAEPEVRGDLIRGRAGQVGPGLHQVGPAADDRDLVTWQVVVDVGDVDEERLAGQEPDGARQLGRLEDQAGDVVAVVRHLGACPVEHVRGVIAHQVVQPPVVVAAVPVVELGELIEPGAGLPAVADAELDDVQLLGQGAPRRQFVPAGEQVEDDLAGGGGVARVGLTAGQRLLVLLAGRLLPGGQCLPVQRVEPPDAAGRAGHPGLEPHPVARTAAQSAGPGAGAVGDVHRVGQRRGHLGGDVRLRAGAAPQVHGELVALNRGLGGARAGKVSGVGGEHRPDHRDLAEVRPVLDPVADRAHRRQVDLVPAQRLDHRLDGRLRARRLAQPPDRPDVNLHRCSAFHGNSPHEKRRIL
jgi:hypothetical protein